MLKQLRDLLKHEIAHSKMTYVTGFPKQGWETKSPRITYFVEYVRTELMPLTRYGPSRLYISGREFDEIDCKSGGQILTVGNLGKGEAKFPTPEFSGRNPTLPRQIREINFTLRRLGKPTSGRLFM